MTAVCAICRELLVGAPAPAEAPEPKAFELRSLAEVTRRHLGLRHKEIATHLSVVLEMVAAYLSVLVLETNDAAFQLEKQRLLDASVEAIRSARIVKRVDPEGPGAPVGDSGVVKPC